MELSLVLDSCVEREKKIAGSQMKLFLVCSDDGKNHPSQCLVRC